MDCQWGRLEDVGDESVVLLRECPVHPSACLAFQCTCEETDYCAVRDEEVAEDQDESGGHCGWVGTADVASFLNGILSEVESSVCVCLQRGVVWALVVVELVCEVQCVERDGGRTAVDVFCHVTTVYH